MSGEPLPSVMKAVRVHKFGGPEVLQLKTDTALPTCGAKQVDQLAYNHLVTRSARVFFLEFWQL